MYYTCQRENHVSCFIKRRSLTEMLNKDPFNWRQSKWNIREPPKRWSKFCYNHLGFRVSFFSFVFFTEILSSNEKYFSNASDPIWETQRFSSASVHALLHLEYVQLDWSACVGHKNVRTWRATRSALLKARPSTPVFTAKFPASWLVKTESIPTT